MNNLTRKNETVARPAMHFAFVEKIGPFMETAMAAWQEMHKSLPLVKETNKVTGFMALYKFDPMTYRAGVSLESAPTKPLPAGFRYEHVPGGKFTSWTLKGSWSQLPQASGAVWDEVKKQNIKTRNDFNVEHYLNSPDDTPEDRLLTEILVATV